MTALLAVLAVACAAPTAPVPPGARPAPRPGAPTKPVPPAAAARPAPSALKPGAPSPVLPSPSPWYVMAPSLNLRRCPGVACSRLAVLGQNEVVLRLREDGEWVEVRVVKTGETGWVAGQFLVDSPVPALPKAGGQAPIAPARPAPGGTFSEEFLE